MNMQPHRVLSTGEQKTELEELAQLKRIHAKTDSVISFRVSQLSAHGISQKTLADTLGTSQATISRMIHKLDDEDLEMKPVTAMELVRRAARGEVAHEDLIEQLKSWDYDARYVTEGLADDWSIVDNSFDAVNSALNEYELITEDEYFDILAALQ